MPMSSTTAQGIPAVDYFSLESSKSQNNSKTSSSPFAWDSAVFDDAAFDIGASDSCNSTLASPSSPSSIVFADAIDNCGLPKEGLSSDLLAEKAFNFGSFEDWMRWEDPSDAALSPVTNFFPELKVEPNSPAMANLEIRNNGMSRLPMSNDECAVFCDDPMGDAPLFQSPNTFVSEIQQRENLYSTPLSWSRPTIGSRSQSFSTSTLSPEEEARLRNIAMPPQLQSKNFIIPEAVSHPASPSSTSSPEPFVDRRKKRKNSIEDEDDEDYEQTTTKHPVVKKTAHNMIEKRYRTNLNDKIAALRDSVPSLRVMSKKNSRNGEEEEDLQGLTPAHKLNKATVLAKATEYIAHLEKRNKFLNRENSNLRARVDAFEILVAARQQGQAVGLSQRQHRNSTNSRQMPIGFMM
ncbi:hypothetical protein HYALB_00011152 [Hymenoscyphus albidus]|uniref:BHLH domain-containing protein n=1 Tax=Hymenoscyphus albidus TaxID=595503 RepID=A0A9N9LSJ8_9HELO|nr:hypothetical protein HYALB_00011152 [Hymenoscyphus albidus]